MKKLLLFVMGLMLYSVSIFGQTTIYSTDFQDSTEAIADWLIITPVYPADYFSKWHLAYYGGNDNWWLSASSWDGSTNRATEQWAIMPAFSIGEENQITLNFSNRMRYNSGGIFEVYYSTDFAGDSASYSTATWVKVEGYQLDSIDSDYDFLATSATFTVDANSTLYIAFKYTSQEGVGTNWSIDDLSVVTSTGGSTNVENSNANIIVYPNPTTDVINYSVFGHHTVTITDIAGKVVKKVNTTSNSINVSDLPNGVYTLTIQNANNVYQTKFVKK